MLWLEIRYANLLSNKLKNYKRISTNLWNCSCPICGDSQKYTKKARGYIFKTKNYLRYHCHNCSIDMRFDNFLREIDEALYLDMKKDLIMEKSSDQYNPPEILKIPDYIKTSGLKKLKKISQLSSTHPAKQYIVSRAIPNYYHSKLFYCSKFKAWTNDFIPNKFKNMEKDDARIIIPFLDKNNNLLGYQGRSLVKDDPIKYITIMLDEGSPRIFGLDDVNMNTRYFVTEGPIDAMFINNCISTAGADITAELERNRFNKDNAVIIYDNEPRSKDTIKKINKAIRKDYNVVIWPNEINNKDINDMVLDNIRVQEVINQNIFKNLYAMNRMLSWKK